MARMLDNEKITGTNFGDSSQLTNWILDSGATCNMKLRVSDFIPGLLEYMDKNIEVVDGHHVSAKQEGKTRIKMCNDNRDTFIATLHHFLLAPDICDRLFSIIKLMNLVRTFLFNRGLCTVYFGHREKNAVTLPHSAHRKHAFLGEIKQISKNKSIGT